jgi:hypothetical protein
MSSLRRSIDVDI